MKKLICLMTSFIVLLHVTAYASVVDNVTVEPITSENYQPLIYTEPYTPPETVQINGETYLGDSIRNGNIQIKYDPSTYDLLKEPGYDWDFDGEYYLRRYSAADNNSSFFQRMTFSIYDKDFNFIRESRGFDGYIADIGYYDDIYYCYVTNPRNSDGHGYYTSPDLTNWTKQEKNYIFTDRVGNTAIRNTWDAEWNVNSSLSVQDSNFYNITYESDFGNNRDRHFGEWLFKEGNDFMCLSTDDIYTVQIADLDILGNLSASSEYETYIYEYGDELVIERRFESNFQQPEIYGYRFRIPKQPVYDALEAQKSAPYVCVNNTILGFETPPVTESDRTLVPMRFLFEQLGADVTWDEATETATTVKNGTTISFSIDNTTATVNGAATTMDVPARLVNDKTMVPLRFLSEEMGYTVEWDEETRMATITTPEL